MNSGETTEMIRDDDQLQFLLFITEQGRWGYPLERALLPNQALPPVSSLSCLLSAVLKSCAIISIGNSFCCNGKDLRVVKPQVQEVIIIVITYSEGEKIKGGPLIPFETLRTAAAIRV